jgi:hypothetical protein
MAWKRVDGTVAAAAAAPGSRWKRVDTVDTDSDFPTPPPTYEQAQEAVRPLPRDPSTKPFQPDPGLSRIGITPAMQEDVTNQYRAHKEWMQKPLIPLTKARPSKYHSQSLEEMMGTPEGQASKLVGGAYGLAAGVESLTTPENIGWLGAGLAGLAGPIGAAATGLYFGTQMIPEGLKQIQSGWHRLAGPKSSEESGIGTAELVQGATGVGMGAVGGYHGVKNTAALGAGAGRATLGALRDRSINSQMKQAADAARTARDSSQPYETRDAAATRATELSRGVSENLGGPPPEPVRPRPAGSLPPAPPSPEKTRAEMKQEGRREMDIPVTTAPIPRTRFEPLTPGRPGTIYTPPERQLPPAQRTVPPAIELPPASDLTSRPITSLAPEGELVDMPPPIPPGQSRIPWTEPNEVRHPGIAYPSPYEDGIKAEISRLNARIAEEMEKAGEGAEGSSSVDRALIAELESTVRQYQRELDRLALETKAQSQAETGRVPETPRPGIPPVPERRLIEEVDEFGEPIEEVSPGSISPPPLPFETPRHPIAEQSTLWTPEGGEEFGYQIPSYRGEVADPMVREAAGERARAEEIQGREQGQGGGIDQGRPESRPLPPGPNDLPPPPAPFDPAIERRARLEGMELQEPPLGEEVISPPAKAFVLPQPPMTERVAERSKIAAEARTRNSAFETWLSDRFIEGDNGEWMDKNTGEFVPEGKLRNRYDRERAIADREREIARQAREAELADIQAQAQGLTKGVKDARAAAGKGAPPKTPGQGRIFNQRVPVKPPLEPPSRQAAMSGGVEGGGLEELGSPPGTGRPVPEPGMGVGALPERSVPTATSTPPGTTSVPIVRESEGLDFSRDPFSLKPESAKKEGGGLFGSERGSLSDKPGSNWLGDLLHGRKPSSSSSSPVPPEVEALRGISKEIRDVLSPSKVSRVHETLDRLSDGYHAFMDTIEPQHPVRVFMRHKSTSPELKAKAGRYLEDARYMLDSPRRAMEMAINDVVKVLVPLATDPATGKHYDSQSSRQAFALFKGIVVSRDLIAAHDAAVSGKQKRPMQLPGGTHIDMWKRTERELLQTADRLGLRSRVMAAVDRHNAMTTQLGLSLSESGRISKEAALRPYYTHQLLYEGTARDLSGPFTASGLRTATRGYTVARQGSTALLNMDYAQVMSDHITRIYLDNMTDNFVAKWATEWDIRPDLKKADLASLRGQMVTGKLKNFQTVELNGKRYSAWAPLRFNETIKEQVEIRDALNPFSSAVIKVAGEMINDERKVFLIPEPVALSLDEFYSRKNTDIHRILQFLRKTSNTHKGAMFTTLGWNFQLMNFAGDTHNVYMDDPVALLNYARASRAVTDLRVPSKYRGVKIPDVIRKPLKAIVETNERDRRIIKTAIERSIPITKPGSYESLFEEENIHYRKEIRPLLDAWGKAKYTGHTINPFHVTQLIRGKLESIPRAAKFLTDTDRIEKKGAIVNTGIRTVDLLLNNQGWVKKSSLLGNDGKVRTHINLENLDPRSVEAAARAARVVLTDYGDVTRAYNLVGRGFMFPLMTWFVKNANFERVQFKNAPLESAVKTLAPLAALYIWNNSGQRKDVEKILPDHVRETPHVIWGWSTSSGKPIVSTFSHPPIEAMRMVGVHKFPRYLSDYQSGKLTKGEIANKTIQDMVDASPAGLYTTIFQHPEGRNWVYEQFNMLGRGLMEVVNNRNNFGRPIVPKKLEGTPEATKLRIAHFAEKVAVPYATFQRGVRDTSPDAPSVFDPDYDSNDPITKSLKGLAQGFAEYTTRAWGNFDQAFKLKEYDPTLEGWRRLRDEGAETLEKVNSVLAEVENFYYKTSARGQAEMTEDDKKELRRIISEGEETFGIQLSGKMVKDRLQEPSVQIRGLQERMKAAYRAGNRDEAQRLEILIGRMNQKAAAKTVMGYPNTVKGTIAKPPLYPVTPSPAPVPVGP